MISRIRRWGLPGVITLLVQSAAVANPAADAHQAGTKYSPLAQINRDNVSQLEVAWQFNTGDLPDADYAGLFAFEDHPRLIGGNLIICTPKRRVIAIDAKTGENRWEFDPEDSPATTKKCRGVGYWEDESGPRDDAHCRSRILLGTDDYRLLAIDARSGKPCTRFGESGAVKIPTNIPELFPGEVVASSDVAVVGDTVVVGSAVSDNQRVDAPSGRVMAYNARTGEYLWQFDPVPRDPNDPAMASWAQGTDGFGQGNIWSSMAVDNDLGLVYLPTTSTSDDFYGGNRVGDNHYSTSVVALDGETGEVVWHQQLVHHNVFDYDLPTRPILIDYPSNGEAVPALVQITKMGLVFVFDRATGEPLVPVVERPVSQDHAVPGEVLSPTQPFPEGMPAVSPQRFSPDDVWGFTPFDEAACRRKTEQYRYGPIYTPPSLQGTLFMPGAGGGPNWGGGGWDPENHILVIPSNRIPSIIALIPREDAGGLKGMRIKGRGNIEFENAGSAYAYEIDNLMSPLGAPCSEPPWAALTALDLVEKRILWEVPLGSIRELAPIPLDWDLGAPGAGSPLVTAGGLVFIGYTADSALRAFDLVTGEELWETALPASGTAVPITYEIDGEQYLVIPAGGHNLYSPDVGDAVIAYKLPPVDIEE